MLCEVARTRIRAWIQAYDNLQSLAVILLYLQVGCSLIGSLGVSYNGLQVANLAITLFALVAIASGSQTLGRTYAVLLIFELFLDIAWFYLYSVEIRLVPPESDLGKFTLFSLQLVLVMQIISFLIRLFSSFVWLQMYNLGSRQAGELQNEFDATGLYSPSVNYGTPTHDTFLGGSIYNPAHYSSLFSSSDDGHSVKEADEDDGLFRGPYYEVQQDTIQHSLSYQEPLVAHLNDDVNFLKDTEKGS